MAQVIIFTNQNGNVTTVYPSGEVPIETVLAKDLPSWAKGFIVDIETLPKEHFDYYDAWEQSEGVISINFNKAKEIKKGFLRIERAPLLAAQDVAFQRALENGADTNQIVAEKQRLRDITNLVDSCKTLDELKAIHC